MDRNVVIGVLAAIVIIGAGAWLVSAGYLGSGTDTATSTPPTATNPATPQQPVARTATAPHVSTGALVAASNSTALITGKVTPNGAQTSYWYEYGKTASLGTRTNAQNIGSGFVNIDAPALLTGLSANTTYSYRLVAQNGFDSVKGSILTFTTNNNPPVTGTAPTAQTDAATAITRTSASLNGRTDPNNSDTSYWFEYGDSTALGDTTAFQSAGAGDVSRSESITVSGLAPATKYFFRMNAQNQFGTVNGAIISFTTQGPAAARAPSADTRSAANITTTTATLQGTVNPNGAHTSYWFEYSDDSVLGHIIGSTTRTEVAGSGITDVNVSTPLTGLATSTTYSYRLVAQNSVGTTRGDVVVFKTKP